MRIVNAVRSNVKGHSPTYLTGSACVGVVLTIYLSARAGWRLKERANPGEPVRSVVRRNWRECIAPGTVGICTIALATSANRLGVRRTAAAQVLLASAESAYDHYRSEVIERHGDREDTSIRDAVAEKLVGESPPGNILVASESEVLCCELFTRRYFPCTMERLKKAQNELNAKLLREDLCTLDEFYYILGLEYTYSSSEVGWRSDKLMELEFSAIMYKDKPVLAFNYNYVRQL